MYEYRIEVVRVDGGRSYVWVHLGEVESDEEAKAALKQEIERYGLIPHHLRLMKRPVQKWEDVDA